MTRLLAFLIVATTALARVDVSEPPFNAIPNDGLDDSAAFQAAALTGEIVFAPRGDWNVSKVALSSQRGQRIEGEGAWLTRLIVTTDPVEPADTVGVFLSAPFQGVRNLTVTGSGHGVGIFVGPHYIPHWSMDGLYIAHFERGVDKRSPLNEPAAYGSDGGSIMRTKFLDCQIGYHARGNKDFTELLRVDFDSCAEAVRVHGGSVNITSGVYANNKCGVKIIEGAAVITAVHFEVIGEGGNCYVDAGESGWVDLVAGFLQRAPGETHPFLRAGGGRINLGSNPYFNTRVNGSAKVFGNGQAVDYNGVANYAAGDYIAMTSDNPLPVANAQNRGTKYLLIRYGATLADRLVQCRETAPGVFAWIDL